MTPSTQGRESTPATGTRRSPLVAGIVLTVAGYASCDGHPRDPELGRAAAARLPAPAMVSNAASWWWEGRPADLSGPGDVGSAGGLPSAAAPPPPVARRPTTTGGLVLAVVLLSTGAAVGMSSIAGFGHVWHRLSLFDWPWVVASAAGVVVAFAGYRTAFDGVVWGGHHRVLTRRQRLGVVAAGFGAFVPRGGTAIDRYVMSVTGHRRRDSDVRLATLQALEMAPLTIGATTAAYAALLLTWIRE